MDRDVLLFAVSHSSRRGATLSDALCNYVLYHAVVSCSYASASLCFVCCASFVVIVRAFPQ